MEQSVTFTLRGDAIPHHDPWLEKFSQLVINLEVGELELRIKASDAAECLAIRSQINDESNTTGQVTIILDSNFDVTVLNLILGFINKNSLVITNENACVILKGAENLQHIQVTNACLAFLMKELSVGKVTDLHTRAHDGGIVSLMEATHRYIRKTFEEYSSSEYFLRLDPSCVKDVVENELSVSSDDIVFQAVIRWAKSRSQEDQGMSRELLQNVHASSVPNLCFSSALNETTSAENDDKQQIFTDICKHILLCENELPRKRFCSEICAVCQDRFSTYLYVCDCDKKNWHILSMKEERDEFHHVAAVNEEIYLFYEKRIEIFFSRRRQWVSCGVTGYDNGEAIVYYEKKFYFFGAWRKGEFGRVRRWNAVGNFSFDAPHPMPKFRHFSAADTLGQLFYVTGGFNENGYLLIGVETYNPSTYVWRSEVAQMLEARARHSCATINGKIYVFGGTTVNQCFSSTAEMFDPHSNQWTFIPDLLFGRQQPSLFYYNRTCFVSGGTRGGNSIFETYDLETMEKKREFQAPGSFKNAVLISIE